MKKLFTALIATLFILAPVFALAGDNDMKVKMELEVLDDASESPAIDRIMKVDIQNVKTFFPGAETGVTIISGHDGFTQINTRLLFDTWYSIWLGGMHEYNALGDEFAGVAGKWKMASKQAVCDLGLAQLWESSGNDDAPIDNVTKVSVEMLYDWGRWVTGLDFYWNRDSNDADDSSIEPLFGAKTPYGTAYIKAMFQDNDGSYEDDGKSSNTNSVVVGFMSTF